MADEKEGEVVSLGGLLDGLDRESPDDSGESDVAHLLDAPRTPEEVAPSEWPRRAVAAPPASAQGVAVELERRLRTIEDTLGVLVDAGSEAIAAARVVLLDEISHAKTAAIDEALAQMDARLGEVKSAIESDSRAANKQRNERILGWVERVTGEMGGVQAALGDMRKGLANKAGRADVQCISTDLGTLGRTVATCISSVDRLHAADKEQKDADVTQGDRITDLVGTLGAVQTRIASIGRLGEEARDGLRDLRQTVQDASARMDGLSAEIQSGSRVTEELAGRVDGAFDGIREARAEVVAAREASAAAESQTAIRIIALEALVTVLQTELATRASTADVERVTDAIADVRGKTEALDSSVETLRAEGTRRDRTIGNVEKRLGGLDSRMSGLDHTVESLTAVDTSLRTDLGALGQEVATLESEFEAFSIRFDAAAAPIHIMEEQASRLSREFEALRVRIDALASTMSGVSGAAGAQEKRIGYLEGRLAVLNEFAGLKEQVEMLDGMLVGLEGWRRVFSREAETYSGKLGLAPPPWVAATGEKAS